MVLLYFQLLFKRLNIVICKDVLGPTVSKREVRIWGSYHEQKRVIRLHHNSIYFFWRKRFCIINLIIVSWIWILANQLLSNYLSGLRSCLQNCLCFLANLTVNFVAVNRLWILFSVYQLYKPGYTAPTQVHHDETTIEIRFVIS